MEVDRHFIAALFPESPQYRQPDSGTGEAAEGKEKTESSHQHGPGGLQTLPAGRSANKCWQHLCQRYPDPGCQTHLCRKVGAPAAGDGCGANPAALTSLSPEHPATGTTLTLAQSADHTAQFALVQLLLQTGAKLDMQKHVHLFNDASHISAALPAQISTSMKLKILPKLKKRRLGALNPFYMTNLWTGYQILDKFQRG